MTATAYEPPVAASRLGAGTRVWRFLKRHTLTVYAILALTYLMLPIAVVILFSFNDPVGRFNYVWQGFTLEHWRNWDGVLGLREAVMTSLQIAALSTLVATALGTLMAMAIVRHHFRGRGTANILVFLPLATPEIVLGASLLSLFITARIATGFWTIFVAHVMFIVSFVVVTVKARLVGFDRHLEEAAMDLGANELTTFRTVTLPLLAPAILAGALLGFAISIDDFIITYFVAGPTQTFPIFVWGAARVAVPPQVNVIASAIFLVAVTVAVVNVIIASLRAGRQARGS